MLEQVLAITVGLADTMMVSSVGEAAVSGVSLVDMLNVLIIISFFAMRRVCGSSPEPMHCPITVIIARLIA